MGYTFAIRDALVKVGVSEDGEDIHGLNYFVVAEAPDGRRWAHGKVFRNGQVIRDDEEGATFYRRDNGEAQEAAEKLLERIRKAGRINLDHWHEIDPCYGSEAYQQLDGEAYFRDREIVEAEDRGEIAVGSVRRMGLHFC